MVISRRIIYSKSSMRVAGQVRVILPLSSFAFFFPSKRILDGFIRGINNLSLSLSLGRDTFLCIFFLFFLFFEVC